MIYRSGQTNNLVRGVYEKLLVLSIADDHVRGFLTV
jgi:hypothetical protein